MNFLKKYTFYFIILLFFCSCGRSAEEQKRISRAQQDSLRVKDSLALKVAVLPTLDCLPIFVAKESHLFDTLGVDVHLRFFNAQMDCDTAIAGGGIEGYVTDLVRAQRLSKRGISLEYVTATNASWQLIANRKARLRRLGQLGDKMVAMTRYSATDYLTQHTLDTVKLQEKVFHIQINNVKLRLAMLLNNEMDAMWLPEPQATKARLHGHNVLADSRKLGVNFGVIAFRKDKIAGQRRSGQLQKFVQAYNMACDSINKNGFRYYAKLLQKYTDIDTKVVGALSLLKYEHAHKPLAKDVLKAAE